MIDQTHTPRLDPAIKTLLSRLRRQIRAYVFAHGVALTVAGLGLAFWLSLTLDWTFEPPAAARAIALVVTAAAIAFVAYQYLLRRLFVRLHNRHMAVLLERRFDRFHDGLLTVVELADKPDHGADFSPEMLSYTAEQTLRQTQGVPLTRVFNTRPLLRALLGATVLAVSVAIFGWLASPAFAVWVQRNLFLSDTPWPRRTRLSMADFNEQNNFTRKVAKGDELGVIALADTSMEVPELVEIRYTTEEGQRGRVTMSQEGVARPQDPFQRFAYNFTAVLSDIRFDVIGGDARVRDLRIQVVDKPSLVETVLHCDYPAYMHKEPRDLPVAGVMQLPFGASVTVRTRANKDLLRAQFVDIGAHDAPSKTSEIEFPSDSPSRELKYNVGQLDKDRTILITQYDTDGIHNREPYRLALTATPDEPPQVSVRLRGIGTAITPQARLPAVGTITDDYGIARAWYDFKVDDGPVQDFPPADQLDAARRELAASREALATARAGGPTEAQRAAQTRFDAAARKVQDLFDADGQTKLTVDAVMDVSKLELKPKQKMVVGVKAADQYDLGAAPNVGAGERYQLDIVTPDQLRLLLEARELMLRRRLETVYGEMMETRNSLKSKELGDVATPSDPPPAEPAGKDGKTADKSANAGKPAGGAAQRAAGAEPGDEPVGSDPKALSPERLIDLRILRIQRAKQNAERSAHETLGIAAAFDDMYDELVNNRVDTEELKRRLKDDIAAPLRDISVTMFPELEQRLNALEGKLKDLDEMRPLVAASLDQADKILVKMRQVLDKMAELETFNQLLEKVREIISLQEDITNKTKEQSKRQLLDPDK